ERLLHAADLQGAFNQAAMRLHPGASEPAVKERVDRVLEPYGALGAVGRDQQLSAKIVSDELSQLKVMGTVLPAIFLAVAMFILNVVVSRQVATQRSQIAALKALGYGDAAIAWHYTQLALLIALGGALAGLALSVWIGQLMLGLYDEVFRFNRLAYVTTPWLVAAALGIAATAAALGTWTAIRAVVRLRPAQAMQPPAPPRYRRTLLERLGLGRRVRTGTLMVVRNFERRPLRAAFTVTGIALAVALQISGAFWLDAIAHIVDTQFRRVQQGDVLISFDRPVPLSVTTDLQRLPGVLNAEAYRTEPVRVRLHGRSEDAAILGLVEGSQLLRVVDEQRGPVALPADGLVMSALLARSIGARTGDRVEVEFRLWRQTVTTVAVVDTVHTMMGKQAFMRLDALNRLARDGDGAMEAALQVDPLAMPAFWAAVKTAPLVNAVFDKAGTLASFNETTSRNMGVFSGILTLFAVAMAVGIVYNAARIALGAPVALSLGGTLAPLAGRVARIEPVAFTKVSALGIEEQRVNVVVDAPAADWAGGTALGEGYRVDARITLSAHDDALLVPTAALVRNGTAWQVLVVEAGKAEARTVEVLDRNADLARLDGGGAHHVNSGEQVVLYPGSTVKAGQRVSIRP
ncbi:MAG: FtsX-like permease family protein, partial [Hydrogenophaga sp.]